MIIKIIKSVGLSVVVWSIASASIAMESGPFMGIQIGNTNTNNSISTIYVQTGTRNPVTNTTPYTIARVEPSNTGMGVRIFVGGQYNPFFAAELGFTRYAPSTFKVTTPNSILTGNPQIRTIAVDLVGKGIFPFGCSGFGIFGKAGIAAISASSSGSLQPVNFTTGKRTTGGSSQNKTSASIIYGLGISYDITQSWQIDLSATQIKARDGIPNATFLALGFSYHIVNVKCGQFLC